MSDPACVGGVRGAGTEGAELTQRPTRSLRNTHRWKEDPDSEEYQPAAYTIKHLGSISHVELAKQYRCSAPKEGATETLKDGQSVPALICSKGTTMHNLMFAYQVYRGKTFAGTSGMRATTGLSTAGPQAKARAEKRKEREAFDNSSNLHGVPAENKKAAVLALVVTGTVVRRGVEGVTVGTLPRARGRTTGGRRSTHSPNGGRQ